MHVTVLLPGVLRQHAGGSAKLDVELADGATLGALLDVLAADHPALDRRLRDERRLPRRYVNVYLDGVECRTLLGIDSPLADGVEVQVIPSVAGG
ncbi:molybdopterin synthase subunit MoaD [Herbihabitans rhizosphaerae]|uniref:Molybdopterin synthase subunit MoaD n=1 Tax=Herbihabitans rhizosphaerae TaxID=1872711 RepID=A0A4Q7L7B5_9PSEU|nr:MoaD/ThiS family protein [Herbihabitans rhizosphaerae]RZS44780.1 molybdopterin synthase subunit MoaD [Herbihabitans rhizosphaerae]